MAEQPKGRGDMADPSAKAVAKMASWRRKPGEDPADDSAATEERGDDRENSAWFPLLCGAGSLVGFSALTADTSGAPNTSRALVLEPTLPVVSPPKIKPTEVQPIEIRPTEVKPTEVKPTEVKPTEIKPTEVKPPVTTLQPGPLSLSLVNDTGDGPGRDTDLYTSDARVRVSGIQPLHGRLQYRIDGSTWQPLPDGEVIPDAAFVGDGRKQLEVRAAGPDGQFQVSTTLAFDVDRTAPATTGLKVVHDRGLVTHVTPEGVRSYTLTDKAEVILTGLQTGDEYDAHRVMVEESQQIPGSHVHGDTDRLPAALFVEGMQALQVLTVDRAGNRGRGHVILVQLDTIAPETPRWSSSGSGPEKREFRIVNMEPKAVLERRVEVDGPWSAIEVGPLHGNAQYRQIDQAGNASPASDWLNLLEAPDLALLSPLGGSVL